jgi:hypothetical protein
LRGQSAEFGCGFGCGGEGKIAIGPSAGREGERQSFALCWIFCVEGPFGVGGAPFAVDQYLSCIHLSSSFFDDC